MNGYNIWEKKNSIVTYIMNSYKSKFIYKKNQNNSVIVWYGEVVKKNDIVTLHTYYGVLDGKIQKSSKVVYKKGRENTVFQRGIKIIEKKRSDKIKKEGYKENIKNIDEIFVSPMLAKTVTIKDNKLQNINYPVMVQPKIDGFRCICYLKNNKIVLLSRNKIEYKGLQTLKKELETLYKKLSSTEKKSLYLDGELYMKKIPFELLSGQIKQAQHHKDFDIKNIKFMVFDCFKTENITIPFSERTLFLKNKINSIYNNIKYVETYTIHNYKDFKKYYTIFMNKKYEGIMIRVIDSPYEISKRSKYLKKYKEFKDEEYKIIGYNEGKGKFKKTPIWICETKDGKKFNVTPCGNIEYRKKLFLNANDYIGQLLTVTYQELSKRGVPRFPIGKCFR